MKYAFACAAIVTAVLSLSGASIAASDPTDEKNIVLPVLYQSPFRDYRPLGEDKNTSWKDANETVGKIGGWRVYAREAADAMKATAATAATAATKALDAADTNRAKPETLPPGPATMPKPTQMQPHKHGG